MNEDKFPKKLMLRIEKKKVIFFIFLSSTLQTHIYCAGFLRKEIAGIAQDTMSVDEDIIFI